MIARYGSRGRGPAIRNPASGIFPNRMAYARFGAGPKTLLWIPGGPGVGAPTGLRLALARFWLRQYIESGYSVWVVARKQDMPRGHTIADMAEDYAELIDDEFDGKVDLVLGESYGGMIGFYLAARHPDRFDHIAVAVAGYGLTEHDKAIDLDFARLLSEGRTSEAGALLFRALYPDIRVPGVARVAGAMLGRLMYAETHPHFRHDVMVEAEAEQEFDAREILPDITMPVLLVGGDRDQYFPREVFEETARLVPDCTLRIYEGKGHVGASSDKRLPRDVLDFVARHPRIRSEGRAAEPVPEPVVAMA